MRKKKSNRLPRGPVVQLSGAGAHRTRRSRDLRRSELDEILGIGSKRKRALLHRFGSVRAVADAGLQDLQEVGGINHKVAQLIYNHFHSND